MTMTTKELMETLDYTFLALIEFHERETGRDLYIDIVRNSADVDLYVETAYRKLSDLWDIVERSIETGEALIFTK